MYLVPHGKSFEEPLKVDITCPTAEIDSKSLGRALVDMSEVSWVEGHDHKDGNSAFVGKEEIT